MKNRLFNGMVVAGIVVFQVSAMGSAIYARQNTQEEKKARNIIVFIGDGMGFNSDFAGTCYRYGEPGKQRYHSFPVRLSCSTFCMAKKGESIPDDCKGYSPDVFWVSLAYGNQGTEFTRTTDSAAASTTLFSGKKTTAGKIGMSSESEPVELISEIAVRMGKKAGTVTTVPISHATPAGFAAHVDSRGKMDEIFLQMAGKNSSLSVLMGAGNPLFDKGNPIEEKSNEKQKDRIKRFLAVGGEKTWNELRQGSFNGFTVLQTRKQFDDLAAGRGTVPEKVIGLPPSVGSLPPVGGDLDDLPQTGTELEKSYRKMNGGEIPDLATMTLGAINVLARNNDKGFVLMVEGGAIDGANHGQNIAKNCFEHAAFSKAVDAGIDWIEKNSSWDETLVIITADHETGQLWGPDSYSDDNENDVFDEGDVFNAFRPITGKGRGNIPDAQYASKGHTNALVPLWAKGPGAELFLKRIKGNDKKAAKMWNYSGDYVDNTDIFHVMKEALKP